MLAKYLKLKTWQILENKKKKGKSKTLLYLHGGYPALPKGWLGFIFLLVGRYNINNFFLAPEVLDIFYV